MKVKLVILLAVAMTIFGCQLSATPPTEFVSDEGKFSVLMPGTPTEETQTTTDGTDIHMFSVEDWGDAYLVGYSDFPQDIIEGTDAEMLLDFARDGAAGDGTILSETSITINGYPGRALEIDSSDDDIVLYANIYLVDNRLYQVIVTSGDGTRSAKVSEFLDSFKLLD
ncbi:MAG: hypothetical protein JXB07_22180 [Anaerolineae bacterium]|nr:hypothetical protein [Anaerolineae bacterium]